MRNVYQTIIHQGDGDCLRAAAASILDLSIDQVPHFIKFSGDSHIWHDVFMYFFWALGYEYYGCTNLTAVDMHKEPGIDGLFIASVPSKTFEGSTHAVVIDQDANVVHDPNPNEAWLGENVYEVASYFYNFEPRNEEDVKDNICPWKVKERD